MNTEFLKKKIIPDFPNYYIYNNGDIYSTLTNKMIKPSINVDGYLCVNLYSPNDKKAHFKYIHSLVAQNFIDNPNNLPQVNHKDENKTNNWDWNLEWVSAIDNANYGTRNQRISESLKRQIKKTTGNSRNVIVVVDKNYSEILYLWDTIEEASKSTGFSIDEIISFCKNEKQYNIERDKWQYALAIKI